MTLLPGEVVLIPFPFSNLKAAKRRPVLVLKGCDLCGDFLAAAITSQAGHEDGFIFSDNDLDEGDLPKTYREIQSKPYRIIYRIHEPVHAVHIHVVADSRRNFTELLKERLLGS